MIALSAILTSIISIVVNAYPNITIIHYSYAEQFRDLFPPLAIAEIMAIIIYPISFWFTSDIFTIKSEKAI